MPFTQLPNATTQCYAYGSGGCCHDYHFDPAEVVPVRGGRAICDGEETRKITTDKTKVNCTNCLELIHA